MVRPAELTAGRERRVGRQARALAALLLCTSALLGACTVGPDYVAPKTSLPPAYSEAAGAQATAPSTAEAAWWTNFGDPVLNHLIDEARRSAPDLASAEARVREARAMRGVAGAADYPEVDAGAAYARTHGSANVPVGVPPGGLGPGIDGNLWQAGFDASWEIDVFGGTRRGIEAANAAYEASVAGRGDAALLLTGEIARDYVVLRGAQRQLAVAQENLSIQRDTLALTRSQFDAGLASRLDVLRAQAQVEATEAEIPTFVVDARTAIYRIGALVGVPPESLLTELDAPQAIPTPVADVPVGLPSDLLQRRPDIREAERQLAAANARIGVAKADLYPHFYLTGAAGLESLDASTFLTAPSRYLSIGPSISWLVFDAGKVRFTIDAEQARTDAAAAQYQRVVLDALRDVETALVSYGQSKIRRERLAAEVAADRDAVGIAQRLYRQGLDDFLPVLDAERSLYVAEDKLAQTDRDTDIALVALYKALGGGWHDDSAPLASNASTKP
ncbi:efflux transporter outer membrane subunit [Paraburkholderia pallida]|uniref:Efflux transporter outer membrane subunit n=1 Tax=Paraburkholderia pallida TaxID=2547399 RepID=A0A4P7CSC7_9BURK|nr:efflux transporter outer membrane subunit [Paraburkholderia pallida]QBQ98858.1 efflux transporter outer membrane subunit [Paraburkholderia pallida]